jgi:casein kinase II subunit alpha
VDEKKIDREIRILRDMRGARHVTQLLDVVRDPDTKSTILILDWAENVKIQSIITKLTKRDIAIYMYGVLDALEFAHSRDIMHRDVKPGNIMFDLKKKDVHLIDWGLAEYYVPGKDYPTRVATRHYKGPELLMGYSSYDCSLDMWSLGCTFASLLFRRVPFFRGHDSDDQIVKLSEIFGCRVILDYAEKYSLQMSSKVTSQIQANVGKRSWRAWVQRDNAHLATDDALDLLDRLLRIDHEERISARDAMRHPFFRCLQECGAG